MSDTAEAARLQPRWGVTAALLFGLTLLGATVLLLYAYAGTYTRPMFDDLCIEQHVAQSNVLSVIGGLYWGWTGNATGLVSQTVGAALRAYAVVPALLLGLFVTAFAWVSFEGLRSLHIEREDAVRIAPLAGIAMTLALLDMSPNIVQNFYWLNATSNYTFTSGLMVLMAALMLRAVRLRYDRWPLYIVAFLSFWVSNGQITLSALILAFGGIGLLFALGTRNQRARNLLLAALAASVVGAVVVVIAPGNAVRMRAYEEVLGIFPPQLGELPLRWVALSTELLVRTIGQMAPVAHLCLVIGAALAGLAFPSPILARWARKGPFLPAVILAGLLAGWLAFGTVMLPIASVGLWEPYSRVWLPPQTVWVLALSLTAYVVGSSVQVRQRVVIGIAWIAVLLLSGLLVGSAVNASSTLVDMRDYAVGFDARFEQVVSRGVLPSVPYSPPLVNLIGIEDQMDLNCLVHYADTAP